MLVGENEKLLDHLDYRLFGVDNRGTISFDGLGDDYRLYILDINFFGGSSPTGAYFPAVRLNGDTGNNYRLLKATLGQTPTFAETALQSYFEIGSAMSSDEAAHMQVIITANSRSGAPSQLIQSTSFTNGSGGGDIHYHSGTWASSAKVTQIDLIEGAPLTGGFGPRTHVHLYGLR